MAGAMDRYSAFFTRAAAVKKAKGISSSVNMSHVPNGAGLNRNHVSWATDSAAMMHAAESYALIFVGLLLSAVSASWQVRRGRVRWAPCSKVLRHRSLD